MIFSNIYLYNIILYGNVSLPLQLGVCYLALTVRLQEHFHTVVKIIQYKPM